MPDDRSVQVDVAMLERDLGHDGGQELVEPFYRRTAKQVREDLGARYAFLVPRFWQSASSPVGRMSRCPTSSSRAGAAGGPWCRP